MTFDLLKYLCFGCDKCNGSGYTLWFHTKRLYGAVVKGDSILYYWYDYSSINTKYKTLITKIDEPEKLIKITGENIPRFIQAILSKTMSKYVV